MSLPIKSHALRIWQAALDAVRPEFMIASAVTNLPKPILQELEAAPRILVVGCGKAGASMSAALEVALGDFLPKVTGLVNVPAGAVRPLQKIRLHAARLDGVNFPTEEGVQGAEEMLRLLREAGPNDVAICLISGGGSALLPAPVEGVSLQDKQTITKLLHGSGATIQEMNCVRKHLSRVKGGRLAEAFRGKRLLSLIVSDVVGDPLDVIASGPTSADPTTFADALAVLGKFNLLGAAPQAVRRHLEAGVSGNIPETPKQVPPFVVNQIIGSNDMALSAATMAAQELGYRVLNLGSFIEGETREVASVVAGIVRNIRERGGPVSPPACVLFGGETTVTLGERPGKGGRNQEFVLAMLTKFNMEGVAVLSAGTDGEDGPTDAAGAVATAETLGQASSLGLNANDFLMRHDAYSFFEQTGALIKTGLTHTNVMDVRMVLVGRD